MQKVIFLVGMHRSGTSALARVTNLLGAALNRELMEPKPNDNERGFWEGEEVVKLHDALLLALGTSWDETIPLPEGWWRRHEVAPIREELLALLRRDFADCPLFAIKDPRMCRLLPFWLDLASELRIESSCIVITRNPAEVVDSLFRRSDLAPGFAYPLWLDHVLAAEYHSRELPRAFVTYDQLLGDWRQTMERVGKTLEIEWPHGIEAAGAEVDAFLEPSLRHHHLPDDSAERDEGEGARWVVEAYEQLRLLAEDGESPAPIAKLREMRSNLHAAELLFGRALAAGRGERGVLRVRVAQLEESEARLEREVELVHFELERRDDHLARAKEVFEEKIRMKEAELLQANRTLAETIAQKDVQIGGISEYFEMRTDELNRLRHQFAEQERSLAERSAELEAQRLEAASAAELQRASRAREAELLAQVTEAQRRCEALLADGEGARRAADAELERLRAELAEISASRLVALSRVLRGARKPAESTGSDEEKGPDGS